MKKKMVVAVFALNLGLLLHAFSQSEIDALRYSQFTHGGTARSMAMSGAFGALGGDFSTLSMNPAGIGIYRRSEFTFTPSFYSQTTTSQFNGNMLSDFKNNFNFQNAGIVLSFYEPETKNAWKGIMFGFGYNRLANYHRRISISGRNYENSMLDNYVSDAQSSGGDIDAMDPFSTQLALYSGAIFMDTNGVFYHHLMGDYGQEQGKKITSGGSMGETVFTLGGNYSDRLFLGATIAIPFLRYYEESAYSEAGGKDPWNDFKSFVLTEDSRTTGVGFNLKLGMIYKPADWVRVGGALHTPTYFGMHDDWNTYMSTNVLNNVYTSASPIGIYDYSLTTPMRAIGSVGFVIQKMGLIGLDYEFVDYSSARLNSPNYKYSLENSAIRRNYTSGNNVRFGTEWRLQPMSVRAGMAYYSSPFNENSSTGSRMDYSAGIGFREQNLFVDIAYIYSRLSQNYYLYDASVISPSRNTLRSSAVSLTLGFKF